MACRNPAVPACTPVIATVTSPLETDVTASLPIAFTDGYGAMRLTGRGIWGAPSDRNAALTTLRRLPELGVNFVDTADSYGPDVSRS